MEENHNNQEETTPVEEQSTGFWLSYKKPILVVAVSLIIVLTLGGAAVVTSETYHKDRIFHGVSIGGLEIGGLKRNEARSILETWHDQWWSDQLVYDVFDENGKKITTIDFLPLIVSEGSGQSYQFISYDLEAMLDQAYSYGRDSSLSKRVWNQFVALVEEQKFDGLINLDEVQLQEVLRLELEEYETLPENAGIILASVNAEPELTEESHGKTFDYNQAVLDTYDQLVKLESGALPIHRAQTNADIIMSDVEVATEDLAAVKELFPLKVNYFDDRIDFDRNWTVRWADVYQAATVTRIDDRISLGFAQDALTDVWERFESVVNEESLDAKFEISEEGKVEQFQPSKKGYSVNREETVVSLNTWILEQLTSTESSNESEEEKDVAPVKLAVTVTEAKVPTADVNDLGISEILGVGYSDFSGSPRNRVHNISIGAEKLDGLLIEPDETFSLLESLKPFTLSEGYLPELVIKGDKIEPEIGGGLCQIGSTTFRAAMKSGLPIAERRNHSLVVDYYNDPRNGNPGTDATIYDSSPDFKFTNDTGNYILITTDMNASTGDLYFTFWGTSDGREADYTEPVVHRWIGTGPTKYVETDDLAPGQKKCQGAHPGAQTSFTYTITTPDGEVKEEVFESSYRPLPTICLVGIDPDAPKEGEGEGEESVDAGEQVSETPTEAGDSEPVLIEDAAELPTT